MTPDARQTRRLIFWNRFWLGLVLCYSLVSGLGLLANHLMSNAKRLVLTWNDGREDSEKGALFFNSELGGPFVVTHLVIEPSGGEPDTALAAIAELPHPLFVRGPKADTMMSPEELKSLVWIRRDGTKVAPPKPGVPVQALYYETRKVTTTGLDMQ